MHFSKKPFFSILLAWNSLTDKTVIYSYGNEILWNDSNIRVGDKTVMFKNWQQSGIKYLTDIFDYDRQNFYTFAAMKEKYILPTTDFLRYLSILNSIPNEWKVKIRIEDKNVSPDLKCISMLKEAKTI